MAEKESASKLTSVSTTNAPAAAGPYSQAIKATTPAGTQIWVSGQIPMDLSGTPIDGTIGEKTRLCCQNVKAVLEAAGSGIDRVVRVGVFLTTMDDFKEMNAEYEKCFTHLPARSCVAVYQLPKGVPVEIEAVAIQ